MPRSKGNEVKLASDEPPDLSSVPKIVVAFC